MPIAFAADAIDPPSNSMASAFLMHALNHSSPHSATMLPAAWGTIGTMVDATSYGDRLAQAMKEADVSVRALADALGVSYQAVRKVTIGQTKSLTAQNNQAAADRLGVSASWLATGDGPPRVGLTRSEAIRSSWGAPMHESKTTSGNGETEFWHYDGGMLMLRNGVVVSVTERR